MENNWFLYMFLTEFRTFSTSFRTMFSENSRKIIKHWLKTMNSQGKLAIFHLFSTCFPPVFRLFSGWIRLEFNKKINLKKYIFYSRNFSGCILYIFRFGISYIFLENYLGIPVSFLFRSFLVVDEIWTFSASKCWVSSRLLEWATESINK